MTSNLIKEEKEESVNMKNRCECYKKLYLLGIPVRKSDEGMEFAEFVEPYLMENAFQLPGSLIVNKKVTEYPVVDENDLSMVFQQMAEVIPLLADFDVNLLSFWMLDIFVEALHTVQCARFPHSHQRTTLLWIAYFFNYFQKIPVSRKKFFSHLKEALFLPEWHRYTSNIKSEREDDFTSSVSSSVKPESPARRHWNLPLPPDIEGSSSDDKTITSDLSSEIVESGYTIMKSFSSFAKSAEIVNVSEINVNHMNIILEILYRIFGRFWVFKEIQVALHSMPTLEQVELPFKLNVPKTLLKQEISLKTKGLKKSEVPEKLPEKETPIKDSHKNDYILPLMQANEVQSGMVNDIQTPPVSDRSLHGKKKKKG